MPGLSRQGEASPYRVTVGTVVDSPEADRRVLSISPKHCTILVRVSTKKISG